MNEDVYTMKTVEEALECVLSHVALLEEETVPLLESVGRVAARDLVSDCDITPFDHAAMDGFAVHVEDLASATAEAPVECCVIAEVPAGSTYNGPIGANEVVRIMTGAPVPAGANAVVKYEIVDYLEGDGRKGSTVAFSQPAKDGDNIRLKGEEIAEGEVAVSAGEVVTAAGVGFWPAAVLRRCRCTVAHVLQLSPSARSFVRPPSLLPKVAFAIAIRMPWLHALPRLAACRRAYLLFPTTSSAWLAPSGLLPRTMISSSPPVALRMAITTSSSPLWKSWANCT